MRRLSKVCPLARFLWLPSGMEFRPLRLESERQHEKNPVTCHRGLNVRHGRRGGASILLRASKIELLSEHKQRL